MLCLSDLPAFENEKLFTAATLKGLITGMWDIFWCIDRWHSSWTTKGNLGSVHGLVHTSRETRSKIEEHIPDFENSPIVS